MKTLLIATANQHKIIELSRMLRGTGFAVIGIDATPGYTPPKENGKTFVANARIKALALREHWQQTKSQSSVPFILADDSGICCDDLNGAPGIYSARYARGKANDTNNNRKLVAELKKITNPKLTAHYTCALVLLEPNGNEHVVEEHCEGKIIFEPQGSGGFGYDPHFYVEKYQRTMAELNAEEKDAISHRGKALRLLAVNLAKF